MQDDFFGRMSDPSAGAWVTGPCGDTMEFYLVIGEDVIEQVKYYTDGCQHTRLCGTAVARRVKGRSLRQAIAISARQVLDELPELPRENHHCVILAVSTFYRAVGQFWVDQSAF